MRVLQEQKGTIIGTYTGNGKVTESYRTITKIYAPGSMTKTMLNY